MKKIGLIGFLSIAILLLGKYTMLANVTVNIPSLLLSPSNNSLKEIDNYKVWYQVTSAPTLLPPTFNPALCAAPAPLSQKADDKNPHKDKYIRVYVNSVGKAAMLSRSSPQFARGAVIVKEKLASADSKTPELLTVMIKRGKGYNSDNGDWEYMVINGTTLVDRGKLENCQACHKSQIANDYVFRNYLPR